MIGTVIRVVVIEDSPTARDLLVYLLESAPDIRVVGSASCADEGIRLVNRTRPDVVTMDVNMPEMDGYEATRYIMENFPTPIVIVSASYKKGNMDMTFRALEAGALTVVEKPGYPQSPEGKHQSDQIIRTVRLMSEIRTVTRRNGNKKIAGTGVSKLKAREGSEKDLKDIRIIAVGASTGGPPALKAMLREIPGSLTVPVVVVQHIVDEFTAGFAEWLGDNTELQVLLPRNGTLLRPGSVYVAPAGAHMEVLQSGTIRLRGGDPVNGSRPSVSSLFASVAEVFGSGSMAVLLSGMGKDGAREMKELYDLGALTVIQDKASSPVFGMPGEAMSLGGVSFSMTPESIGAMIRNNLCATEKAGRR